MMTPKHQKEVFEITLEGGIADGKTLFIKTNCKSLMIHNPEMEGKNAVIYYKTGRVAHKGNQIWAIA